MRLKEKIAKSCTILSMRFTLRYPSMKLREVGLGELTTK